MDNICKEILKECGIEFDNINDIYGKLYPRELFLSDDKYNKIKIYIPQLKQIFSSCYLTSLHEDAYISQKWPLLNLIRQILNTYGLQMLPIRKCNGYTEDGKKKFKRFFQIKKNN